MAESVDEQFADDEPDYAMDAAADVDADVAAEVAELEEDDPGQIPKDEGDPGQPEPAEDGG